MTKALREISLKLCTMLSYRQAVDLLNRIFHRKQADAIKQKTYADFCIRTGKELEEKQNSKAAESLTQWGFQPENGEPVGEIVQELKRDTDKFQELKEIKKAVQEWNTVHTESAEQIKTQDPVIEIPQETVYISVDDIGVKHQKEHRTPENEKQGVYVWNTVATIESSESTYTLTNIGMRRTFCNTLAYLLEHRLLEGKHLVFLTDGAKDIRKNIEDVFGFRQYSIILDWYHLKKRCQEYLSMSIKGGKKIRNEILQKLLRILWTGNVDDAIGYLNSLQESFLRPQNRILELCAYFEKNRVCIPCYALRNTFHLKNSSNRVEKANDLTVARRQKHHGMSWSISGSGAIAQIQVLFLNSSAVSA